MRFWITTIVGIFVISGLSAALYIWNPETFTSTTKVYRPERLDAFTGQNLPRLEFDQQLIDVPDVSQFTTGETRFPVRNEGESELHLRLGSKSCTCAAIRLEKDGKVLARFAKAKELEDAAKQKEKEENPAERDKITDAVLGEGNVNPTSVVALKPGEKADFVIEWDTKDTTGTKQIGGEIFSNDPRSERRSVMFDVRLAVIPELLLKPQYFSFGQLRDDQKREESLAIFSMANDDLQVEVLSSSHPALSVDLRPMTEEEKKSYQAKSGFVATATVLGKLPVGDFNERVMIKTNVREQAELSLSAMGIVDGLFEVHPGRVDFGTIPHQNEHKQKVSISSRGLPEGEILAVDEKNISPDFVRASIRRHEDSQQVWILDIVAQPTGGVGKFHGVVPIVNSKGEELIRVAITGTLVGKSGD